MFPYIVNVACLLSKDYFANFPRALILLEEKSIFRLSLLRSPRDSQYRAVIG